MFSDNHGKIDGHIRLCDEHGKHGPLYPCNTYTQETLDEITAQSDRHITNLRSKKWCDEQIANGMPVEGIAIFRAMAGISNNNITA